MKTSLLTLLLVLSLTASGWAAPTIWDTTLFNQSGESPYTDPAEDYKSHTSGVAVFLSATWNGPYLGYTEDGIRWVHHFTPLPSDSITAARLLITLDDDDHTDPGDPVEQGRLSIEGHWTEPNDVMLLDGIGTFEVDDGTYAFPLSPTKISWLYSGTFDCVFRAVAGDFYIVRSDIEVTLADQPTPDPNGVPEPVTLLLLGFGLFGFAGFRRKFKR